MNVTVVVPTYQRPRYLERCVAGLQAQSRRAEQVVVVRRVDDSESAEAIKRLGDTHLTEVTVSEPGVLAAMTVGLQAATGDVIALLDDDAVPRRDWLGRLLRYFDDPEVGGTSGRDIWVDEPVPEKPASTVGEITTWGKLIGNHHLGAGAAREVAVLKGANIAFRREALALPQGVRGTGAQPHFEVAMSLWARKQGWRLVYDPAAIIDHFRAPRLDSGPRDRPYLAAIRDGSYNLVSCLLALEPELLLRRALYGLFIGDRESPGLIRAAAAVPRGERDVLRAFVPSLVGQTAALVDFVRGRRIQVRSIVQLRARVERPRPRVALVAHDIHDLGGMERVFRELIRRSRNRAEFIVIAARLSQDLQPLVDWKRVRVPRRPFPLKFAFFFVRAGRALRRVDADIVETMGAIVPNCIDIASVHFCHAGFVEASGSLAPPGTPLGRRVNTAIARLLALAAERWCYRSSRARVLAAVSQGVGRELAAHYPGPPIIVTPNGVDAERFAPNPDDRRELRGAEQVVADEPVVIFVGGDWERKGLGIAIEGVAKAARDGTALRLWVVGHGNQRRYQRFAQHHGVDSRVTFFGRHADTQRFYAAADIFVLPTLYEAAPLVAYEAAASGLPIVATRVSGIDELVGENEAGILVERTPEAVGAALARLAHNPEERARLGQEGRRRARAYTWERSTQSTLDLYRELIGERTEVAATAAAS